MRNTKGRNSRSLKRWLCCCGSSPLYFKRQEDKIQNAIFKFVKSVSNKGHSCKLYGIICLIFCLAYKTFVQAIFTTKDFVKVVLWNWELRPSIVGSNSLITYYVENNLWITNHHNIAFVSKRDHFEFKIVSVSESTIVFQEVLFSVWSPKYWSHPALGQGWKR